MTLQFVGEAIQPSGSIAETPAPATGEPALPPVFNWRGEAVAIERLVRSWKETSPCRSGSREQYVRKHWYEVETAGGRRMKLYFERQARSKSSRTQRWWLFSVES